MDGWRREDAIENTANGGRFRGYGWPATLELLSPPIGKPVDSRQVITRTISSTCNCVHESGGVCIPRHSVIPAMAAVAIKGIPRNLFFQSQFFSNLKGTPFSRSNPLLGSTVMGNDNARELSSALCRS